MSTASADVDARCKARLRAAGLRPTAPRIALCRMLLGGPHRHVRPQDVLAEARAQGIRIAQATVYNVLSDLVNAGLLGELAVPDVGVLYDTNTEPHCHVVDVDSGAVRDVPLPVDLSGLPMLVGEELVDLVIRVRGARPR